MVQLRFAAATEHDDQAALFRLVDLHRAQCPALANVFAVPNGGQRHPAVAAKLKAEGVQRGVPDVLCLVACQGYHGLALELKTPVGTVAPEQRAWHDRLRAAGYRVEVCRGWAAAWAMLCDYLGLPE